jgi:hypothetical protein
MELRLRAELAKLPSSEGAMAMAELITPNEEIILEKVLAKGRVKALAGGFLRALNARF